MQFNVSQLMREPSGSSRSFEIDEEFASTMIGQSQRLKGMVNLLRTDQGVWLSAKLESEALCSCSRCLSGYMQPFEMTIEEECLPMGWSDVEVAEALSRTGTEERVGIDEDQILDLTEAVRQYTVLSVPMKQLCRDDCKGICSKCGANLNEASCQCDMAASDSRWGLLLDLDRNPISAKTHRN